MKVRGLPCTRTVQGLLVLLIALPAVNACADDSGIIKADRQALAEAQQSGISSKILAAKEQLSDDLAAKDDQIRSDAEGIAVPLVQDSQGHFLADVLINDQAQASLVVDTGSPIVLLTYPFIEQLGLDISHAPTGTVEFLSGKYKVAVVRINSLKLGDAEAQDVKAAVLLEDAEGLKDGILGLTFLSKFHFVLDQEGQKLVLRKLDGAKGDSP